MPLISPLMPASTPCYGTLYKLLCSFASNVSVVTNANVLQMSVISISRRDESATKCRT